jgi:3-isopropylmalate/(R)-2-methylmalate dehydratase small subunit
MEKARGKVICYGADIDTDVIIPARYLNTSDPLELAKHCMEDSKEDINAGKKPFALRVEKGNIMVADKNFGCGSSREHAPIAIKASGISCVIAKTFARIFYRNSINIGLPILECPEAVEDIKDGDIVEVDFDNGIIVNESTGHKFQAAPFPPFMQKIIANGGLVNTIKKGEFK